MQLSFVDTEKFNRFCIKVSPIVLIGETEGSTHKYDGDSKVIFFMQEWQ